MVHDSVKMFANVVKEIGELNPVPLKCTGNNDWSQGEEIIKAFDEVRNYEKYSLSLIKKAFKS